MDNKQINFFKSKDINTVLKPIKKGTVVEIDTFDIKARETLDDGFNNGVYRVGDTTQSKNTASDDLVTFELFLPISGKL